MRRDLLAGLLRLADALDFYPDRAPEGVFRTRASDFLENPIALKHWLNHYFASAVYLTIGDVGGNRYLDCKVFYTVPSNRRLNRRSYKIFFAPLFNEFLEEARRTDFDVQRYPLTLLNAFDIRGIRLDIQVDEEAGAIELPDKVVAEISQSDCRDMLEFLSYLSCRGKEGIKEKVTRARSCGNMGRQQQFKRRTAVHAQNSQASGSTSTVHLQSRVRGLSPL